MEIIFKYVLKKKKEILQSPYSLESLFNIIHSQEERIFCEYIKNYRIYKISYNEFKSYILKFATYLDKQIDFPKGSIIGLQFENSPNFIAIMWATLILGYRPLLINVRLPDSINNQLLKLIDCKTIIRDKKYSNHNLECKNFIDIENKIELNEEILSLSEIKNLNFENEILLTTTATSLNAKICVYKGEDIVNELLNFRYIIKKNSWIKKHYKHKLKLLTFLPFYHIFGLFATYLWFAIFGRTFVFMIDYNPQTIINTIKKHEVTHVFSVPLMWNTLAKEIKYAINSMDKKTKSRFNLGLKISKIANSICPNFGLWLSRKIFKEVYDKSFGSSLYFCITGGGYIKPETLELLNLIGYPLFNGYGSTEIGITSVTLNKSLKKRCTGGIGMPLPSVEYKIIDNTLHVRGKSTCSKIISSDGELIIDHNNFYNTNDIVDFKDGAYYILGRKDDVFVNKNGEKINPDIIEQMMVFESNINYSVLQINEELCLIIELDEKFNYLKIKSILLQVDNNIKNLLSANIKIDSIYYSYQKLMNKNAIKVSRKALIKMIEIGTVKIDSIKNLEFIKLKEIKEITSEIEKNVIEIMAKVLSISSSSISVTDNFITDLKGTSLDYFSLVTELENQYDINFPLDNLTIMNAHDFSEYIIKNINKVN